MNQPHRGLDPSKFDQQTAVVLDNISKTGFWQANMSTVTANGEDLGLGSLAAILDTGTTLLVVPVADAQALHAKIPGSAQCFQIPHMYLTVCCARRREDSRPTELHDPLFDERQHSTDVRGRVFHH